jgi:hypothetical protein
VAVPSVEGEHMSGEWVTGDRGWSSLAPFAGRVRPSLALCPVDQTIGHKEAILSTGVLYSEEDKNPGDISLG